MANIIFNVPVTVGLFVACSIIILFDFQGVPVGMLGFIAWLFNLAILGVVVWKVVRGESSEG